MVFEYSPIYEEYKLLVTYPKGHLVKNLLPNFGLPFPLVCRPVRRFEFHEYNWQDGLSLVLSNRTFLLLGLEEATRFVKRAGITNLRETEHGFCKGGGRFRKGGCNFIYLLVILALRRALNAEEDGGPISSMSLFVS